jgi:hypothetical protein
MSASRIGQRSFKKVDEYSGEHAQYRMPIEDQDPGVIGAIA